MKASAGPFKALLIDWDGTLIDSLPLKIANAASIFGEYFGADPNEVAASYARHSGVPRRMLFDKISLDCLQTKLADAEFDELSRTFTERNKERIVAEGSLRTDAAPTISVLRDRGVLVFISTSAAPEEIEPLAHHFGLDRLCAGILGSKPAFSKGPGHVRWVMRTHTLSAIDLAGIGDDLADMTLFSDAGIFSIGITGTRSRTELLAGGADMVIDSLQEVLDRAV